MVGYEDRFGRGDIRLTGYLFTIEGAAVCRITMASIAIER
jgi:hypothetical protein